MISSKFRHAMKRTLSGLSDVTPPWLLRMSASQHALDKTVLAIRQEFAELFTLVLDASRMTTRADLFSQFVGGFQFPQYFGGNWNAFADCMCDLSWLGRGGFVLVLRNASVLLVDGDPDEFPVFLKLMEETGESFSQAQLMHPPLPFRVILHSSPEVVGALDLRLRAAGREVPMFDLPGV